MAYNELIKNFRRIRDYMRDFFVYGFKSRSDFDIKSGRSYDNERRRVESYLGEYMSFRQTSSGKTVFISIDSRNTEHNPLYKALKSKSFTDGDITLHFILFDVLYAPELYLTLSEITEKIDKEYLSCFSNPMLFDESTVRKKLKEYMDLGLIEGVKHGKQILYSRKESFDLTSCDDVLKFFSEAGLVGVIGSYLLDKIESDHEHFTFKHHYITHALDSDILCRLFLAISEKRNVTIKSMNGLSREERVWDVIPLKIYVSVQSGRHYLMGYSLRFRMMRSYRLDYITDVKLGSVAADFDHYRDTLNEMEPYIWGVSCKKDLSDTEHAEFTIRMDDDEEFIYRRLEREKRCGMVTRTDKHNAGFSADIYDTWELVPWIRTFIGRITKLKFSNRTVENQFRKDLEDMYRLYAIADGQTAIQKESSSLQINKRTVNLNVKDICRIKTGKALTLQKDKMYTSTIYHEIYGCYYNCVAKILSQAVDGTLTEDRMKQIIQENGFGESFLTILPALKHQQWQLLCDDLSTPIKHKPTMPLTTLQLRWLKAISLDPRVCLFRIDFSGLDNIDPLFTPEDYVVFDKFKDGDPFEDDTYIHHFHTIMDAMHQKRKLRIQFTSRKGERRTIICIPVKLEYSQKDDKFRLITAGCKYASIVNLARIVSCELLEQSSAILTHSHMKKKEYFVLELLDERKALDRVMLHFAHYEKQAEWLSMSRYRVTIYYDQDEEMDLVIRVLSFGPMVKVMEPSRFTGLIKDKLNLQRNINLK